MLAHANSKFSDDDDACMHAFDMPILHAHDLTVLICAQVENTLSKIASNIHSWQKLEKADENQMEAKARLYKKAKVCIHTSPCFFLSSAKSPCCCEQELFQQD